jgi:hypothetical protein
LLENSTRGKLNAEKIVRKFKQLLFICLLFCHTLPALALTLVYIEESGSDSIEHTITIAEIPGGYTIGVTSVQAEIPTIIQELEADESLSVLSWTYRDPEAGTDFTAIRTASRRGRSIIAIKGRYRGKAVNRRLAIDEKPWYQLFPHGMDHYVLSQEQETLFYAVGYEGIGALRLGTFRARRGRVEQVERNGRLEPGVYVHISFTGLASIFWSGDYWFRPGDGRNLIAKSDRGPGTDPIVVELISER